MGVVLGLSIAFFRSWLAVIPLAPVGYAVIKSMEKRKGEQVREELTEQFRECILSVSASLQAGYALENAFLESREDMKNLYGEQSFIYEELEGIRRGLITNIPIEEQIAEFGHRSGCEVIEQFARMLTIAKRRGGNIPTLIRTSAELIGQKMDCGREIATLLSGRKMEQNIMRLMPFAILFYVNATYPGYFDPLYHNLAGVAVMSLCLGIYGAAILLSEKILGDIQKQMDGVIKPAEIPGLQGKKLPFGMTKLGELIHDHLVRRMLGWRTEERIRRQLRLLGCEERKEDVLSRYFSAKIGVSLLVAMAGSILSLAVNIKDMSAGKKTDTGDVLLMLSLAASVAVWFLTDKDLADQVEHKKQEMLLAYPDFVHRLVLYLTAGLTIRASFQELSQNYELAGYACRELMAGHSEQTVYEHFGKRAGPREYVKLSALLCQNLKKGNNTLIARLEEEAIEASEKRMQGGRRLGEEAGTKLLVPMVMFLAVVMVMVMVPAFSVMGL